MALRISCLPLWLWIVLTCFCSRSEAQNENVVLISLSGTRLVITGTDESDEIAVIQSATELKVFISNQLLNRFPRESVKSVFVNLGAGDDIFVAAQLPVRCAVNGGNGSDVLVGGRLSDVLNGGSGNDAVVGGLGADTIAGWTGEDLLISGALSEIDREVVLTSWRTLGSTSARLNAIRSASVTPIQDFASDSIDGGIDQNQDVFLGDFMSSEIGDLEVNFNPDIDLRSIPTPRAPERLNILLITADDLGMHLGCYGDTIASTPNMDAFAGSGCRFTNGYVCHGSCSPSRASMLTGLYPHQHGLIGNVLPPTPLTGEIPYRMKSGLPNLPTLLRQRGYYTGIIGKLHIEPSAAFEFHFKALGIERSRNAQLLEGHMNDFASKRGEKPFFLMINIFDPHRPMLRDINGSPLIKPTFDDVFEGFPFNTDRTPENRMNIADYFTCVNRLDELMGHINSFLVDEELIDNTLVVFMSDNGPAFDRAKVTPYEAGIKLPLMIRWPGVTRPNQIVDQFVSSIDLMPTLLGAARVPVPAGLPGRSLRKLLSPTGDPAWRDRLYAEFTSHGVENFAPQRTIRRGDFKLMVSLLMDQNLFPEGVFADQTLTDFFPKLPGPYIRLYNLANDPYERTSLADDPAHFELIQELLRELEAWRIETNDPLLDVAKLFEMTQWHIDAVKAIRLENE